MLTSSLPVGSGQATALALGVSDFVRVLSWTLEVVSGFVCLFVTFDMLFPTAACRVTSASQDTFENLSTSRTPKLLSVHGRSVVTHACARSSTLPEVDGALH